MDTETDPPTIPRPPVSRADLFDYLAKLGIETVTMEHAPVFTVDEARSERVRDEIPGGHCKSLFLKSKKGSLWLVVADEARQMNLNRLAKHLGSGNLSFGKPELLAEVLGVTPGSVTPFALINDPEHRVRVVLDQAMLQHDKLNYHPLVNTATTTIASAGLQAFIAALGHETYITDLENL